MFAHIALPRIVPGLNPYSRFFSSSTRRPFTILGVQQIAIGSLERESLSVLWYDILGAKKRETHRLEKENVVEDIVRLGPMPYAVEVDLMTPIDPNASPKVRSSRKMFFVKMLRRPCRLLITWTRDSLTQVHQPPLNHIGLWVDKLEVAVDWMAAAGVRFAGGIRTGAAGHNVAFIHPKGNESSPIGGNGVLIELVQAPKEVIAAFKNDADDF